MTDLPPLLPLLRALSQIPVACWRLQPAPQPQSKDEPMADATTETEMPNATHSDWLENVLMAEDGPLPAPVLFASSPKVEQLELVRVIGDRLRQARELCNLSQSVAAQRLGYSNSSKLSKVEGATDTNSVPLWLILRAAKVYEVSIDFLFGVTDDWEVGARMSIERETSAWLFDTWEKARQRDMAALKKLHDKVEAMSEAVALMLTTTDDVGAALARFMELNPGFEDMPGGARLLSTVGRATGAAKGAKAKMARFRVECVLAAADTHQLSLAL